MIESIRPARDSEYRTEYRAALRDWWNALDAWNAAGEPLTGSVYKRLNTARDRFITACNARSENQGDET